MNQAEDSPFFSINQGRVTFATPLSDSPSIVAVDALSLSAANGELVALLGPSGCGKTTILNVLAGELALELGSLKYCGHARPRVAALWQEDQTIPWRTAAENVAFPLELAGVSRCFRMKTAIRWLKAVGLGGFEDYFPAQLSGGMKKRVALAAALAAEPNLLLLDEPLAALDHSTKLGIQQEILAQWERLRPTIVMVTHAADEAVAMADRIIVLTKRPGTVFREYENPLPRPRRLDDLYADAGFHEECRKVWAMLKEAAA